VLKLVWSSSDFLFYRMLYYMFRFFCFLFVCLCRFSNLFCSLFNSVCWPDQ